VSTTPPFGHDLQACARAREAISAGMDGESAAVTPAAPSGHLQHCQRCREFQVGAADIQRRLEVLEPACIPDLSRQILLSAPPLHPHRAQRAIVVVRAAGAVLRRRAAWAVAALPLVLVLSGVSAGALTSHRVVATDTPTPCTDHLTDGRGVPGDDMAGSGPHWLAGPSRGTPERSTASVRNRGSAHGQDSRT